jgi:aspartyl-tRNA(Asn)/glutamyl-tRNA(Gln) amidotransferase subunit C
MPISRHEVEHIARLARLELSEDEIVRFERQLSDILDYAARLGELDTCSIPPTATVLPLKSVLREDETQPTLEREQLLKNAPRAQDGQFRVPPVLEGS